MIRAFSTFKKPFVKPFKPFPSTSNQSNHKPPAKTPPIDDGILRNLQITDKRILLISEHGDALGTFSPSEAMTQFDKRHFNLVQVQEAVGKSNAVCKIIPKVVREERVKVAKSKDVVKELDLTGSIGSNDFLVKMNRATKLLSKGNHVLFTFKRTPKTFKDDHVDLMHRSIEHLKSVAKPTELPSKILPRVIVRFVPLSIPSSP